MRKVFFKVLLVFTCLPLLVAGCGFSGGQKPPDKPVDKPAAQKLTVKVYRADQNIEWLLAETSERELPEGQQAERLALDILVGEAPKDSKLVSIFPSGVKARGLKIENGLATADFTKELLTPGTGGSSYEMLLVGSIINTLTEFPAVKAVRITVEGKPIETINGHMDLLDPLKRNESLVKKN